MANMSYCRFENTKSDLADCVNALRWVIEDGDTISEREWRKAEDMRELCEEFLELFDEMEYHDIKINIED